MSSSCCGGKCGCGSGCGCGSSCNGCGKYPDIAEKLSSSQDTLIIGVAPNKPVWIEDGGEMWGVGEAENGCSCGRPSCNCHH